MSAEKKDFNINQVSSGLFFKFQCLIISQYSVKDLAVVETVHFVIKDKEEVSNFLQSHLLFILLIREA